MERYESMNESELNDFCENVDNENDKLKSEMDELKAEIQSLTKKNERLQKSVDKKYISERSFRYLKKSYLKYVEQAEAAIISLSSTLEKAEKYIREIENTAHDVRWKTSKVNHDINELFEHTNDMFRTLNLFGVQTPKWGYGEFLQKNIVIDEKSDEDNKIEDDLNVAATKNDMESVNNQDVCVSCSDYDWDAEDVDFVIEDDELVSD